jgi:hypothetical protein
VALEVKTDADGSTRIRFDLNRSIGASVKGWVSLQAVGGKVLLEKVGPPVAATAPAAQANKTKEKIEPSAAKRDKLRVILAQNVRKEFQPTSSQCGELRKGEVITVLEVKVDLSGVTRCVPRRCAPSPQRVNVGGCFQLCITTACCALSAAGCASI